ncbi:putative methyltransferase [Luteimonas cucumeris]|uniref:Putative methyltransferase n=1 Tax=Luteimonas cucumeris TaxID=985012 RepID=A0A562KUW4_9GAMM|nr:class I SAM-dependent methyltransferase [Luteimonas cucumeris]TWH99182.1 putative methyltransferase [Luteimonas cucumeris]
MSRLLLVPALSLAIALGACAKPPAANDDADAAPTDAPATTAAATDSAATPDDNARALEAAIAGDWRTPDFVARDTYRHPRETLSFFGIAPNQTVIEITPGGGWYTEILAPYLYEHGTYVAAIVDPGKVGPDGVEYQTKARDRIRAKLGGEPGNVYGRATTVEFDPKAPVFGAPGSADAVLTFRNVHNWVDAGTAEAYFKGLFDVLKPGGVLGVADHRAKPGTDLETMKKSGYLTEELVIKLATDAGFRLDAKSEVNANPKDTADHPNGVWTLPPSNDHDAADDAKYKAIGESDRMTLRFVKP